MESRKQFININIFVLFLFIFSAGNADAKRRFLAKKYTIPSIEKSHIVMGSAEKTHLNPKSIKVLVWNLLKAERKSWNYDFTRMSKDKDILLLQEGYLNDITEYTFGELNNFRFDFGVSFLYNKDNDTPTGTVVGSSVVPLETGILRTKDFEPFIKTPKTMTWGKYPIAGSDKSLLVISIHGMNFTKQYAFNNQVRQALAVIDKHSGPAIFAGDFNTRTKKRLRFLKTKMKMRRFKEIGYVDDKRMSVFGNVLDHTFTRGLLIRDSKVLVNIKSSDHKAMELDLVVDN
jgi:endonuclease/exonuclease/phosphatase (EEP) superfamily protein YafD